MRDKRERSDNNDFVWKVLLPECFIKFYMDFFTMDRDEAEYRNDMVPLVLQLWRRIGANKELSTPIQEIHNSHFFMLF